MYCCFMRILFASDTYVPQINGVSVVVAGAAAGMLARGWATDVVAPQYPALAHGRDTRSAVGSLVVPSTRMRSIPVPRYPEVRAVLPNARRMSAAFDAHQPDVVFCATEFVIGSLAMREATRRRLPVVTTFQTDFGRYARSWGLPWLAGPAERYLAAFHRRSDCVLTPSGPSATLLQRIGVADPLVWGCGVDTEIFHPRYRGLLPLSSAESAPIGTPVFTYLYVGRLAPEKNITVILDAFTALQQVVDPSTVRLLIAGGGPSAATLARKAPSGVTFLGYVDRLRDLPSLYASSDAFVFASETETLGLVVLEAMASGLPVLAVPAGGVADHLRNNVNGLAVAAGGQTVGAASMSAAMERVATDEPLRVQLAAGARTTATALRWDAEYDRLDGLCRTLLGVSVATAARGADRTSAATPNRPASGPALAMGTLNSA